MSCCKLWWYCKYNMAQPWGIEWFGIAPRSIRALSMPSPYPNAKSRMPSLPLNHNHSSSSVQAYLILPEVVLLTRSRLVFSSSLLICSRLTFSAHCSLLCRKPFVVVPELESWVDCTRISSISEEVRESHHAKSTSITKLGDGVVAIDGSLSDIRY